ncbi:50S ribosomal protein L17 [Candidatus Saccharibacteria bacterium]|nr:50S ribosomal protein L17 [Candidatus Saccharibacteria bacterium]MBQ3263727.1 50S ribosomal protein L17 [Candidatus Saccharibacteria bacterium]
MHRHGYKGRKFGRETDQRLALRRGLVCSLIKYQTITTTLARAKEIRREAEKLITLAKKGGLSNRRLVISRLDDVETANLLVDVIAPQITRNSGYLRIEHAGYRRGDNSEMGTISFVDEIEMVEKPVEEPKASEAKKALKAEKAPKAKKEEK